MLVISPSVICSHISIFNAFLVSVLHISLLMFIKDEKPLISAEQEAAVLFQHRVTEKTRSPNSVCASVFMCVCPLSRTFLPLKQFKMCKLCANVTKFKHLQ